MNFMNLLSGDLDKLNKFCSRKYVLDDVHFTRKRKIGMDDLILHILANKKRSNSFECLNFYQKLKEDDFVTITPQALVKKDNI